MVQGAVSKLPDEGLAQVAAEIEKLLNTSYRRERCFVILLPMMFAFFRAIIYWIIVYNYGTICIKGVKAYENTEIIGIFIGGSYFRIGCGL